MADTVSQQEKYIFPHLFTGPLHLQVLLTSVVFVFNMEYRMYRYFITR